MLRALSRAMWRAQSRQLPGSRSGVAAQQVAARASSSLRVTSRAASTSRSNIWRQPWHQQRQWLSIGCAVAAAASSSSSSSTGASGQQQAAPDSAVPAAPDDAQRARIAQLLALQLPSYCCGCGVKLQQTDPDAPGYFQVPRRLLDIAQQATSLHGGASSSAAYTAPDQQQQPQQLSAQEVERRALDAAMEAWLDEQQRPAIPQLGGGQDSSTAGAEGDGDEAAAGAQRQGSVRCARCYSLVHYGKVKSAAAEAALPPFDLGKKVGRKIALQRDRRATVLCVVDVADFDGSLPRAALASLFPGVSADTPLPQDPDDLPFTLAVAVNKFDLLPPQATPQRVRQWVRARLQQAGLPRASRVFMVSALKGLGVGEMCKALRDDMGFRADLWVVGAQNAGKSSLIAAMRRAGGSSASFAAAPAPAAAAAAGDPTIAPIPGTTLGLLRVPGVPLGPKHRTFDTPGVPHPYQLTSRLPLRELAAVLPRRRLKPRTYVLPIGSSILLGGYARVDAVAGPSANIYVTVFCADEVVTHMGKTAGADERRQRHAGGLLTPPFADDAAGAAEAVSGSGSGSDDEGGSSGGGSSGGGSSGGGGSAASRLAELGPLVPRTAVVEGASWKQHSKDVAIAGLGWVSVGVSGTAELQVWVPQGVMVTLHDALILDYAKVFQKPGFSRMLPGVGVMPASTAAAAAAAAAAGTGRGGSKQKQQREAAAAVGGKRRVRKPPVRTQDSLSDADDDV